MLIPHTLQEPLMNIVPLLTSAVIAPHGMTDLIHAENNDKVLQLFRINIVAVAASMLLHMMNMDGMTTAAFLTSSAIHFRHDFPIKNEFLKLFASSALVMNAENIGVELFIIYMCFIHVPNHYKIYKPMIMDNMKKSLFYISLCAIVATYAVYSNVQLMYDENVFCISKALIVSHIVYEELYTKNNTIMNNVNVFD
jgi:hypothetical protein